MAAHPDSVPRDPAKVQHMFGVISKPYDLLNRLFSLGIDTYWRRRLIDGVVRQQPGKVLDLATGSGDVALLLQNRGLDVTGMDFCEPMLELARKKGLRQVLAGDAMHMPFADASFDAITIAFGFRNFADYPLALREILRVLKPGGSLHILEFSNPPKWFSGIYHLYLGKIMPNIAGLVSGNRQAYSYLAQTVEKFPPADQLAQLMAANGYSNLHWQQYTFGIVAIHQGYKK